MAQVSFFIKKKKNFRNNWPKINHNSSTTRNWQHYKKNSFHIEYIDLSMPKFKNPWTSAVIKKKNLVNLIPMTKTNQPNFQKQNILIKES